MVAASEMSVLHVNEFFPGKLGALIKEIPPGYTTYFKKEWPLLRGVTENSCQ